jgi:hypothetical protein
MTLSVAESGAHSWLTPVEQNREHGSLSVQRVDAGSCQTKALPSMKSSTR